MAQRAYTITRYRVLVIAAVIVLCLIGALLPYLTLTYLNFTSELIRPTHALFPTTGMLGSLDVGYLPATTRVTLNARQHGVDVLQLGSTMQEVGLVAAIITISCILMNEINKFFWWPLVVSGFLLVLGPVAVFVGAHLLTATGVAISVHYGWIPLVLAGLVVIVVALRNRSRLDSYRGV